MFFAFPHANPSSGLQMTLPPAWIASTATWVSAAPGAPSWPSTRIVIVWSPFARCGNDLATLNDIEGAYWLNVPFAWPSIHTEAFPCVGPVTVNHVTVLPLNANDAVAPSRCSIA